MPERAGTVVGICALGRGEAREWERSAGADSLDERTNGLRLSEGGSERFERVAMKMNGAGAGIDG